MTNETVSAILDSILEPLASILIKVNHALTIANAYKLPDPYIRTIRHSINRLDAAHDQLLEIATALDPTLCEPKP